MYMCMSKKMHKKGEFTLFAKLSTFEAPFRN